MNNETQNKMLKHISSAMCCGMLSTCDVQECMFLFPTSLSILQYKIYKHRHLTQINMWLQFISHLFTLWPDHPANEQDRVCLLVLH